MKKSDISALLAQTQELVDHYQAILNIKDWKINVSITDEMPEDIKCPAALTCNNLVKRAQLDINIDILSKEFMNEFVIDNPKLFLRETVIHELCHLLAEPLSATFRSHLDNYTNVYGNAMVSHFTDIEHFYIDSFARILIETEDQGKPELVY